MARIGIDIDNTITDSSIIVSKYAHLYDNNYNNKIVNDLDNILRGFFNTNEVERFFKDYALDIGNEIMVKPYSVEVINKLKEEGHEIIIITARSDEYYGNVYNFCKEYLEKNNIKFDKLIVDKVYKVDTCVEEKIDIMIDDGVDTCDEINLVGIKAFLFTSDLNQDKDTLSPRVNSWKEAYNKINDYLNERK